jgi:hypothetical protein
MYVLYLSICRTSRCAPKGQFAGYIGEDFFGLRERSFLSTGPQAFPQRARSIAGAETQRMGYSFFAIITFLRVFMVTARASGKISRVGDSER